MDFEALIRLSPYLLDALWVTVSVCVASIPVAIALGLLIALLRLSTLGPFRFVGGLYSDFFRSTPFFIQIVWLYYALPILTGIQLNNYTTGVIALSCYIAAYHAEVFRAAILSVPSGQRDAAVAQGMTSLQVMRRVILPQATVKMMPAVVGTIVSQIKDSAIVSVIAVSDIMFRASSIAAASRKPFEVLTAAAVLYIFLAYPPTLLANYLHRRSMRAL